jgi:hypothetical protein
MAVTSQFINNSQNAVLSVPASDTPGAKRTVACSFGERDGKRLTLTAGERIPLSTAVSVEYNDALFLGEVVACFPNGDGFELFVEVEQVLGGLSSLMVLRSRLLGEPEPLTATTRALVEVYA